MKSFFKSTKFKVFVSVLIFFGFGFYLLRPGDENKESQGSDSGVYYSPTPAVESPAENKSKFITFLPNPKNIKTETKTLNLVLLKKPFILWTNKTGKDSKRCHSS